jgi:NAD(P)-dependent dehydrogenase (short-subunit alcohol dehydrogenase family)
VSATDLTGKTILITGGNSGIGKAAATRLAGMGARVIITSRDPQRGESAVRDIERASGRPAEVRPLDLARMDSVREFADAAVRDCDRLDVAVLNAGIMSTERRVTEDGFELMFQVNHLGHFLLTRLLQPLLEASAPSRVVVVASVAHKRGRLDFDDLQSERSYRGMRVYATTKLANVLFAAELARRLEGTGVTANSLHPGTVRSGWGADGDTRGLLPLGLRLARWAFLSPEQGARTVVHLAAADTVEDRSGGYYARSRLLRPAPRGRDRDAARRLWELSEELVAPWR